MREIGNHDLTASNIPPQYADWGVIGEFALTFDGYSNGGHPRSAPSSPTPSAMVR